MSPHEIPWWITLVAAIHVGASLVWATWKTPRDPQRLSNDAAKALDVAFRERLRVLSKGGRR